MIPACYSTVPETPSFSTPIVRISREKRFYRLDTTTGAVFDSSGMDARKMQSNSINITQLDILKKSLTDGAFNLIHSVTLLRTDYEKLKTFQIIEKEKGSYPLLFTSIENDIFQIFVSKLGKEELKAEEYHIQATNRLESSQEPIETIDYYHEAHPEVIAFYQALLTCNQFIDTYSTFYKTCAIPALLYARNKLMSVFSTFDNGHTTVIKSTGKKGLNQSSLLCFETDNPAEVFSVSICILPNGLIFYSLNLLSEEGTYKKASFKITSSVEDFTTFATVTKLSLLPFFRSSPIVVSEVKKEWDIAACFDSEYLCKPLLLTEEESENTELGLTRAYARVGESFDRYLQITLINQLQSCKKAADILFTWREVVSVLLDAAKGLKYMNDKGFIHMDFKPGNLLVYLTEREGSSFPSLSGKITDFGCTVSIKDLDPVTDSSKGTDGYFLIDEKLSEKRDLYAFGHSLKSVKQLLDRSITFVSISKKNLRGKLLYLTEILGELISDLKRSTTKTHRDGSLIEYYNTPLTHSDLVTVLDLLKLKI